MGGTRKLEKFELEKFGVAETSQSGTRKLEAFDLRKAEDQQEELAEIVAEQFAGHVAKLSEPEIEAPAPAAEPVPAAEPEPIAPVAEVVEAAPASPRLTPVEAVSPFVLAKARSSRIPEAKAEPAVVVALELVEHERPIDPNANIASLLDPFEHEIAIAIEAKAPEPAPVSRSSRSDDREEDVEKLRTRLARKFTSLADEVTEAFADFRIGAGAWSVELTAPEGMSTGGGKQVLQHLRLKPTRKGHAVLVGGVVNPVTKIAELRDHDHMEMISRARFGTALDISYEEWEQFLRKAEVVLQGEEIRTERAFAPKDLLASVRKIEKAARMRKLAIVALAIIIPLALLVGWRVVVALAS